MPSFEFSPGARQEFRKIIAHIKRDDKEAAERWFLRLQEKCGTLAGAPHIGRIREDIAADLYIFPFGDYLILYDVVPNGIQVVHVIHGAQDVPRVLAETRGDK